MRLTNSIFAKGEEVKQGHDIILKSIFQSENSLDIALFVPGKKIFTAGLIVVLPVWSQISLVCHIANMET